MFLKESYDKGYLLSIAPYLNGSIVYSFIVKIDINGNELWHRSIGDGINVFIPNNLVVTLDHGIVICGSTFKYGGQNCDPYIIKLNSCGELEWCNVIYTPGIYDFPYRVRQTSRREYILLTFSDQNFSSRVQLYKLDSTGELLWRHNYSPDSLVSNDDGRDLIILSDGYLITAKCYYPDPGQSSGGYERPYFIKTDTAGNDIWRLVYGSSNGFHGFTGYSTLKSSTNNFYSVGWHSNYCDTPALTKVTGSGNESYFQDIIPGACSGGDGSINFLNDTTLVVFAGGTVGGIEHRKWIRMDTLGIEQFSKEFPPGYIDGTGWTIVTSDNKIVGLSDYGLNIYLYKLNSNFDSDSIYTYPYVYDSLCPHPIVSDTINPDCGLLVNVNEPVSKPEETQMKIFPNPANKQITIEFPGLLVLTSGSGKNASTTTYHQWNSAELEVYDLTGSQVFHKEIPYATHELEVDVSSWNPGMFFFRLVYGKQTVAKRSLLISR